MTEFIKPIDVVDSAIAEFLLQTIVTLAFLAGHRLSSISSLLYVVTDLFKLFPYSFVCLVILQPLANSGRHQNHSLSRLHAEK